jgi:hypothetical protein
MPILSTAWTLHDMYNVEEFVRLKLTNYRTKAGTAPYLDLTPEEQDDAMAAMLEAVLVLSKDYCPDKGMRSFTAYVNELLIFRFIDYLRKAHLDLRYDQDVHFTPILREDELGVGVSETYIASIPEADEVDPLPESDLLKKVDLERLSLTGLTTLTNFAIPLQRGAYIEDLAELHNVKPTWIRRRLNKLAKELDA